MTREIKFRIFDPDNFEMFGPEDTELLERAND